MNNFYKGGRELPYLKGLSHYAVQQKTTAIRQHFQTALQVNSLACQFLLIKPITLLPKLWKSKAILLLGIALLHMFSLSAQTPRKDSGANGLTTVKSLKIGDTIPEFLWNRPLEVVNHPSGKKTMTLSDYRDKKLIVLDFWATWCSSCVAAFPGLYQLENDLNKDIKVLSVTYQDRIAIEKFISKSEFMQSQNLLNTFSSVVSDNVLTKYFEKDAIPFTVCIDHRGVVRALAMPSELKAADLRLMVQDPNSVPIASKVLAFTKPLLQPYYNKKIPNYYYSTVLPYGQGISQASVFGIDSVRMVKQLVVPNVNVFMLYGMALQTHPNFVNGLSKIPSRRILEVHDPQSTIDSLDAKLNFWKYTYESISPITFKNNQIYQKMENDLNHYLGFIGSYQQRDVNCLVINIGDPKRLSISKNPSLQPKVIINGLMESDGTSNGKFLQKVDTGKIQAKNALIDMEIINIPNLFNKRSIAMLPFMIDETGSSEKVTLTLPDNLNDLSQMQTAFSKQGLQLSLEKRKLIMFVLTQDNFKDNRSDLTLTKYGYVSAYGMEDKR